MECTCETSHGINEMCYSEENNLYNPKCPCCTYKYIETSLTDSSIDLYKKLTKGIP